jgi:RNA-directed DNA polymerase
MFRELRRWGASEAADGRIAGNGRQWWRNSRTYLNGVLPVSYFDNLGVPRLS